MTAQPAFASDFSAILHTDNRTPFDTVFDFEAAGMAHPVLASGHGPGVILMHELPGFVSEFWRLARWIEAAGFRVYAPAYMDPAGSDLEEVLALHGRVGGMARACVSREIRLFRARGRQPGIGLAARAGASGPCRMRRAGRGRGGPVPVGQFRLVGSH